MPVNGVGSVLLPLAQLGASLTSCTVRDREAVGGTIVWAAGAFVPGTPGVVKGQTFGSNILLEVVSGSYDFRVQP